MPVQKSQLHRLMRISALLKENRYPNSETLIREFQRISLEEDLDIECSKKTILRDMKLLKEEFHCPLAFDRGRNGYYLKHHGWEFISPATLDENEMIAAVIGARIAENIFPAPLKNKIRNAVDSLLQSNNPDFLDNANMASLSILSGLFADLDPDIFMTIFTGWQNHRCVEISYADFQGQCSLRIIEPHTLVFFNNSWYTKSFCHKKQEARTFALRRISSARLLPYDDFEPSAQIISSINPDDFLAFEKVENVTLEITPLVRDRLVAAPLHSGQTFPDENHVSIPAVSRETLFPFILSQQGGAILTAPDFLRKEFIAELQKIYDEYK